MRVFIKVAILKLQAFKQNFVIFIHNIFAVNWCTEWNESNKLGTQPRNPNQSKHGIWQKCKISLRKNIKLKQHKC